MVKASKGSRCKSRNILRKSPRERGLSPITREFQKFQEGDKVSIHIDSSVHKGAPDIRFHGKTGTVIGSRGRAYILQVKDGDKYKTVIARPEHLKKAA
ncbi:MAG: 50S ribosomal protein L21e [Methanomassiliicoccales archaeon]|jgi:large subunit ribosomal protein L21e|nr:50S ribosomal protein L21e [Methanomassiliicoccales archaeon]